MSQRELSCKESLPSSLSFIIPSNLLVSLFMKDMMGGVVRRL